MFASPSRKINRDQGVTENLANALVNVKPVFMYVLYDSILLFYVSKIEQQKFLSTS